MAVGFSAKSTDRPARYNGRLTPFVIFTCIMATMGGIIFGYDLGVSGGLTSMEPFLRKFFPKVYERMKEQNTHVSNYCKFDSQILTAFTSTLYLSGLVASIIASSVTRAYGRKASMLICGLAVLAGGALGGAAANVYMLILGRLLLGVGVGFANQSVPLYLSEMSPPQHRGAINNGFELSISIGYLSATLINYETQKIKGDLGFRISLALVSLPALFLTVAAVFLPETPNSLLQRGADIQKTTELLGKIRGTADVDKELQDIIMASNVSKTIRHPFREITRRNYRPQLVMAILIPFFQQVTGINIVTFYAPVLFRSIGLGESASLMSAVVTGAVGLCSNIMTMMLTDKFGRRALFMVGGVQMFVSMLAVGGILEAQLKDQGAVSKAYGIVVLIFIGVYCLGFGCSWGPLGWSVPSEIFPLEIRSAGQSIFIIVSLSFTFVLAQSFLAMLCHLKAGMFYFFGGWLAIMTMFIYFFLPETSNIPIEQMVGVWSEHWFWKRFVDAGEETKENVQTITNS